MLSRPARHAPRGRRSRDVQEQPRPTARTRDDAFDVDCTDTLHLQLIDGRFVVDRNTNDCRPV